MIIRRFTNEHQCNCACGEAALYEVYDELCATCFAQAHPEDPGNLQRIKDQVGWHLSSYVATKGMHEALLQYHLKKAGLQ